MNIVLTLTNYKNLTGSEIYVYELSRELIKKGHKVMILANDIGGDIQAKTKTNIMLHHFFDHPDFVADIVINSQPSPTAYGLTFFPRAVQMQILHSLFDYEEPVIDKGIDRYVAVRPEIKKHWSEKYPELENRIAVIWNGFDEARFNHEGTKSPRRPLKLFVGTFDHLRRNVIMDLVEDSKKEDFDVILCMPFNPFIQEGITLPKNITYLPTRWDIEALVKECTETVGIFIGRTTIEGFLCGKPALIYDVDEIGRVTKKYNMTVPKDLEQFGISYMTDKLLELV